MIRYLCYVLTRYYILWLFGLFFVAGPTLLVIAVLDAIEQAAVTLWISFKDKLDDIGITKETLKRENYLRCKKRFDKVKTDV